MIQAGCSQDIVNGTVRPPAASASSADAGHEATVLPGSRPTAQQEVSCVECIGTASIEVGTTEPIDVGVRGATEQ